MKTLIQEKKELTLTPQQSSLQIYFNNGPVDDLRHDMIMDFRDHLMDEIQYTLLVSHSTRNSMRQSTNHPCSTIQFYRGHYIGGSMESIIRITASELTFKKKIFLGGWCIFTIFFKVILHDSKRATIGKRHYILPVCKMTCLNLC